MTAAWSDTIVDEWLGGGTDGGGAGTAEVPGISVFRLPQTVSTADACSGVSVLALHGIY